MMTRRLLMMLWTAPALRHRSAIDWSRQSQSDSKEVRPGNDDGVPKFWRNWRGHDDVMQTRSIRGSGEPVWVNASSNACFRLGPDPRRALWPAASPPHKQAGHMTAPDQCCTNVRKFLPRRRRPHMTQSRHRPDRNPAAQQSPCVLSFQSEAQKARDSETARGHHAARRGG